MDYSYHKGMTLTEVTILAWVRGDSITVCPETEITYASVETDSLSIEFDDGFDNPVTAIVRKALI